MHRTLCLVLSIALVGALGSCARPNPLTDTEPGEGPLVRERMHRFERAWLLEESSELLVQFISGRPGDPITEQCVAAHELDFTTAPDGTQLQVTVWDLRPAVPPTFPELVGCDGVGHPHELVAELTEGQVQLVQVTGAVHDVASGEPVLVIIEGEVLSPTAPTGWTALSSFGANSWTGRTSWVFERGDARISVNADRIQGDPDEALELWRTRRRLPEPVGLAEDAPPDPLEASLQISSAMLDDGTPAVIERWTEESDLANLVFFRGRFRYSINASGTVAVADLEEFANSIG